MSCVTMFSPKNCRHCGRTFTPTGSRSRYCSADCRYRVKLAALTAKRHRERVPRTPTPRECGACGKTFQAIWTMGYCDRRCRTKARYRRRRRALVPPLPQAIHCKHCGTSFVWQYAQRSVCDACQPARAREHQRRFWAKQLTRRGSGAEQATMPSVILSSRRSNSVGCSPIKTD